MPEDLELCIDPYKLYLSAKYLQKSFSAFDEKFSIQVDVQSAYEQLCEGLDKLPEIKSDEHGDLDSNLNNAEDA